MRSCARRRRAAATIFIALVICCVFFTLRIRRRMSIRLAMDGLYVCGAVTPLRRLGSLLVGEELLAHLLHGGDDRLAEVVGDRLLLADLGEDLRLLVAEVAVQLPLE